MPHNAALPSGDPAITPERYRRLAPRLTPPCWSILDAIADGGSHNGAQILPGHSFAPGSFDPIALSLNRLHREGLVHITHPGPQIALSASGCDIVAYRGILAALGARLRARQRAASLCSGATLALDEILILTGVFHHSLLSVALVAIAFAIVGIERLTTHYAL